MRRLIVIVAVLACTTLVSAQAKRATLDIYLIDVEGGNATLFVAPSGESLLIDAGNIGAAAARDAARIMAAVTDAGLSRIDHLIITHYHGDHFGGVAELASRVPIREFIDHGANVQPAPAVDEFLQTTYPALYANAKHTVVKPGDRVAMAGVDVRIVAAAGNVLQSSVPGGGSHNSACDGLARQDPDPTENAQSVSTHFTFGSFRAVHMGDLTWNKEMDLMCPVNRLGEVDLFVVSHHGQAISNSPALVHALAPRVAILNNGTRKGGQPEAMKVLFSSPGLENLWQLHFSQLSGQEYTVPGVFIANGVDDQPGSLPIAPATAGSPVTPGSVPAPVHNGQAYWIKVSAQRDGSFTVTNARNGFSKRYAARGRTS